MPRPQVLGAEPVGKSFVEAGFPPKERLARQLLELIEQLEEPLLGDLLQIESHAVVIGVAKSQGRVIPQSRQLAHALRDAAPELLRSPPGPLAPRRVRGGLQNLQDLVLAQRLAVDLGAEGGEVALHRTG